MTFITLISLTLLASAGVTVGTVWSYSDRKPVELRRKSGPLFHQSFIKASLGQSGFCTFMVGVCLLPDGLASYDALLAVASGFPCVPPLLDVALIIPTKVPPTAA